jgi:predicted DNA-binding protein
MDSDVKGKIKRITVQLPEDLYEKLRYKSYEEGYSMQETLLLLINYYINDTEDEIRKCSGLTD